MEKFIYDENNGLWYELQGDYYIPCLKLPDEEQKEIGVWGMWTYVNTLDTKS
ncbi:MAG TPA: TnpV protein [Herbinix luporum]|nr:TnpV protein [Herbinix luporum]